MEDDTYYCSFVSTECIICECGDDFPDEESLKIHLDTNHGKTGTQKAEVKKEIDLKPEKKAIVIKQEPKDEVVQNVVVFDPKRLMYITKPMKKETFVIKIEPEIKEEQVEREDVGVEEEGGDVEEEGGEEEGDVEEEDEYVEYEEQGTEDNTIFYEAVMDPKYQDEIVQYEDVEYETVEYGDVEYKEVFEEEQEGDDSGEEIGFACDVCNKIFPHVRSVNLHKRVHAGEGGAGEGEGGAGEGGRRRRNKPAKNCVCEVCGKKYASNAALRYHQRVHTGERPFECSLCPKKFTMALFLQVHMRTHTGEKPYQCPHCPKAFSNKAALLRHDRVHTGAKPFACPECGKAFSQSNSMKLHIRTVHLKQPAPYKSRKRALRDAGLTEEQAMEQPKIRKERRGSTFKDVDALLFYKRDLAKNKPNIETVLIPVTKTFS